MNASKNVCNNCGKGIQHANLVSHAKNRSHTVRKPNLHAATLLVDGKLMKTRLCTKCLRISKKLGIKVGGVKKELITSVVAA